MVCGFLLLDTWWHRWDSTTGDIEDGDGWRLGCGRDHEEPQVSRRRLRRPGPNSANATGTPAFPVLESDLERVPEG